MRLPLRLHPDCSCEAAAAAEVEVRRPRPGELTLEYRVTGAVAGIVLPAPAAPARADGLWRATCFEAFIQAPPAETYYEFNFSPSREWAAYGFDGYRAGMRALDALAAPRIESPISAESYAVKVALDLGGVSDLRLGGAWRLALAAVIEEEGGRLSYWALAHPPGRPDFHHPDGFACEISPGE